MAVAVCQGPLRVPVACCCAATKDYVEEKEEEEGKNEGQGEEEAEWVAVFIARKKED